MLHSQVGKKRCGHLGDLSCQSSSQDSFLGSPRLEIATIEVEILLGPWLLSGLSLRAAWVTALVFFGILAGVSLYLALIGQHSCGCLGRITVSPWLAFAIDVAALAGLAFWRPARTADPRQTDWLRSLLKTAAGTLALLGLMGGLFLILAQNPADALARLRGEAITVEPPVSDVGEAVAGEERAFTIRLTNHTDRPVRITGGTTGCWCIATDDLPTTVPEGGSRPIAVRMTFNGGAGHFRHGFVLYTDDAKQPTVTAWFAGRVTGSP